ncbi:4-(cytidine 5'-diphospho)-2-C-methyl-D-erythritol kinase [Limnohabitans sp. MMS-10A-160]|uniref:4-(cytidine 5'-diphospho)-2-C-methyl-D-erythritol kinase n=1 Tax=unclassified Limnohabitans TaxID=2626134 RepID=UPI000D37A1C5|nr:MULTISPECIES: 4-(cytidine 5'-diphospho)-2-C-methyl-D-erythritol kinase [unclassified Limnohabitans]PUE18890.1 4-(cytidine 5'-diphospho)-2-C-methyl-D-erythritol kinase [Limnohabitans sp. MMS-10A-192]PUE24504.1 4-(cytidine 5'-diphospho)-2-C-methyl-D-erythritol kinase [Limnohabitans sp. MMS-10A-160]
MKSLFDVPAPAKLNLFLHITGRRPDGYHLLQSVFMLIDWCDTLHFEKRSDGQISREDLTVKLPADDLITRAARLLQQHTGCTQGVHIAVEKRIPAQAGMGGGSSDAATCLLALNQLWDLRLDLPTLEKLGLQLGADVPFFLRGRNAWVEGVGEQITPIELPPAQFWVIKPAAGIETSQIFAAPELQRSTNAATIAVFAADTYDFGHNDLQPVAEALCPDVKQALQVLSHAGLNGRMTGSGSAVFARCTPGSAPVSVPDHWQVRKCSNLDVHPLVGWAPSDNYR